MDNPSSGVLASGSSQILLKIPLAVLRTLAPVGSRRWGFLSFVPVCRMIWVKWVAVEPDVAAVTIQLNLTLGAVVTAFAQRLQLAQPEFIEIAMVRLDMVDDGGQLDQAALRAEFAQRVFLQLVAAEATPARAGV
jgi:hypothetical protein